MGGLGTDIRDVNMGGGDSDREVLGQILGTDIVNTVEGRGQGTSHLLSQGGADAPLAKGGGHFQAKGGTAKKVTHFWIQYLYFQYIKWYIF